MEAGRVEHLQHSLEKVRLEISDVVHQLLQLQRCEGQIRDMLAVELQTGLETPVQTDTLHQPFSE